MKIITLIVIRHALIVNIHLHVIRNVMQNVRTVTLQTLFTMALMNTTKIKYVRLVMVKDMKGGVRLVYMNSKEREKNNA